ncbi:hypothetical protein HG530_009907 [Fusarium avenaceum]|nr:hypothetical protein HG530_009907 [Fusarium avenaceum]
MSKLVKFLVKDLANRLGHGEVVGLFLELFDQLVLAIRLEAELATNTLHLLHEPIFSLSLADLVLHILANLGLELGVHELLLENHESLLHPLLHVEASKHLL